MMHREWLNHQKEIQKTQYVRHARLSSPLYIKIDGISGQGVVLKTWGKNE